MAAVQGMGAPFDDGQPLLVLAYKDLTAEQIERNFRIAIGLRKRTLSDKDAALWINDL
jgi:hypothetical protein